MIRLEQEPLRTHTTFRIGGPAAYYFIPEREEEIIEARDFAKEKGLPYIHIETDYSQADVGQLDTRIAAFLEMI